MRRWGVSLVILSGLSAPGALAADPHCFGDALFPRFTLERRLDQARLDVRDRIRRSPNARPILDFVLEKSSPVSKSITSDTVEGLGSFRLRNDLRTGLSQLEWLTPKGTVKKTLFDSSKVPKQIKWGRVDSVRLHADRNTIVVRYRSYDGESKGFSEFGYPLYRGQKKPRTAPLPAEHDLELFQNYKEVTSIDTPEGTYSVRNYGLNASTDVVFVGKDGSSSVFFSTLNEKKNNTSQFESLQMSPDHKYLAITTYQAGTRDDFDLKIFDRSGNVLRSVATVTETPKWTKSKLYFSVRGADRDTFSFVDATTTDLAVKSARGAPQPADFDSTVAYLDGKHIYLAANAQGDATELRIVNAAGEPPQRLAKAPKGFVIEEGLVIDGDVALNLRKGAERLHAIYPVSGDALEKPLVSFTVPEGVRIAKVSWGPDKKSVEYSLQSSIHPTLKVKHDVATQTFDPPNFVERLLKRDGVEYLSTVVNVPSADGTLVPLRLTHRKDLKQDGSNPVFMRVYGGFGIVNSEFDPRYDSMTYEFMRRGGVFAAPAARGGGEFGETWHRAAMGTNKHKTIEDVVATTKWLISEKFTQPRKVILSGTSNGGFVVGATALESPESFGLVIPINGVLDFSRAETYDARRKGWNYEYGVNANAKELAYKESISPVLSASKLDALKEAPEFLIVKGQDDTRVNPLHSTNFYLALQAHHPDPKSVLMLSMPNSGHWGASPATEKATGWATKALFWTRIFDFVGWKF